MKPNFSNRHRMGKISFSIPYGFFGCVTPDFGEEVLLLSADKNKNIEIRIEKDCEEPERELGAVIMDLGEEIMQPLTALTCNGLSGFCAAYRGCRTWYYEAWLCLDESTLRIIIRSSKPMSAATAYSLFQAMDLRSI